MLSRRLLIFMVVMASLVATGRPALILPEAAIAQQIAARAWPERIHTGRTISRIGVLQRITLSVPQIVVVTSKDSSATFDIRPILVHLLRCALPPPAINIA